MLSIVGDIGGTNSRLCLFKNKDNKPFAISHYQNSDYDNLDEVVAKFMHEQQVSDQGAIAHASFAMATPVFDQKMVWHDNLNNENDHVELTNTPFDLSKRDFITRFGFKSIKVINDFTALAYCLPVLSDQDMINIGGVAPTEIGNKIILGPGTGLGMGALIPIEEKDQPVKWHAMACELGHSTFCPNTKREFAIATKLRERFYRVSIERLISGIGIKTLYETLAALDEVEVDDLAPAEVTKLALEDQDPLAIEAIEIFCETLGRVAGDQSLHFTATGGVYIAGGIVPKILEFFKNSRFRQAFDDKGRMEMMVKQISTQIVTHKDPALLGGFEAIKNEI